MKCSRPITCVNKAHLFTINFIIMFPSHTLMQIQFAYDPVPHTVALSVPSPHLLHRQHGLLPGQPAQVGPSLPGQVSQSCLELIDQPGATLQHFFPGNTKQQRADDTQAAESSLF